MKKKKRKAQIFFGSKGGRGIGKCLIFLHNFILEKLNKWIALRIEPICGFYFTNM